jgi:hypothetical protein
MTGFRREGHGAMYPYGMGGDRLVAHTPLATYWGKGSNFIGRYASRA